MTESPRQQKLDEMAEAIEQHGVFWQVVQAGVVPRWAYSTGLVSTPFAAEVVLAGCMDRSLSEVAQLLESSAGLGDEPLPAGWHLVEADPSWVDSLLLAAIDFHGGATFDVKQLVPPSHLWTIDVPDMTQPLASGRSPAWRWLDDSLAWPYQAPRDTVAVTDLVALRGGLCRRATRFDDADDFEVFALSPAELAAVEVPEYAPLATLLAHDPTLAAVMNLGPREQIVRGHDGAWVAPR